MVGWTKFWRWFRRITSKRRKITREDVVNTSILARLDLTDNEIDDITEGMKGVCKWMECLDELNTKNVKPLGHPINITNRFRNDEIGESLTTTEALANAPKHDGEYFLVPKVIDKK